jgi:hypothetical protein
MAHLGTKTSDGQLAFDKYVKNNPKWSSGMQFSVEYGMNQIPIVQIKENKPVETGVVVNGGQPLHIMSKSFKTISRSRYVKIKLSGGSGVQGYLNISHIRKPTNVDVMKAETLAIRELDQAIRNIQIPITIVVNRTGGGGQMVAREITQAKKIGGTQKADIALFDKFGNPKMWISHKKEGDASAFQQYGGISSQSGANIYNHPESKAFMRNVLPFLIGDYDDEGELILSSTKLSTPLYSKINSSNLKRMSLFGPDVMSGTNFGSNNVNLLGQGYPILKPIGEDGEFELTFSSHMITNEDVPDCSSGSLFDCTYEPVFVATYRAGRGFTLDNKNYRGVRLGIAPLAMVKRRQGIVEV